MFIFNSAVTGSDERWLHQFLVHRDLSMESESSHVFSDSETQHAVHVAQVHERSFALIPALDQEIRLYVQLIIHKYTYLHSSDCISTTSTELRSQTITCLQRESGLH
jgi:hypothetical protein